LQGFFLTDESIYLQKDVLEGPNLDIEAKIFRFYIAVIVTIAKINISKLGRNWASD